MSDIASRLAAVRTTLPADGSVELVAVSKFHPAEAVMEAYSARQRRFGESRAQELTAKAAELPKDIAWHFIGHLQTNKVKAVVTVATVIESVDSVRLLTAIDAEARKLGRSIDVLLEVAVTDDANKTGFTPEELTGSEVIDAIKSLTNTRVTGVMGMASLTDDEARIRADFQAIADSRRALASATCLDLTVLSMGMSDDYQEAITCGSTHVRIGTAIFGRRS